MKLVIALAGLGSLCASLVACSGSPPPPAPASLPRPAAAIPPAVAPNPVPPAPVAKPAGPAPLVAMPTVPTSEAPAYDPKGRRDPFISLEVSGGSRGLEVSSTKLTGIVHGARTTLALVETQDGIGYILKPGDTLGDGRLLEIGADSVVFAVSARPGSTSNTVVLKLAAN